MNGKRQRKAFYGPTRADIAAKITRALRDREQGMPIIVERQTVGQFLEHWLENCARPRLRPRTFDTYEQALRLQLRPAFGHLRLQRLTPQHVQQWLNERHMSGASARSCQYARAVLRTALTQALRWGLVVRNVATLVEVPRVQKHEIKPFTPEQARAFLGAVSGHRLEALFSVAVALGLRQGEALGLRWDDVDLDGATLRVRAALQRVKCPTTENEAGRKSRTRLKLVEPKSARSRRTVTLPAVVTTALKVHRVRQLEERLAAGKDWKEQGFVFTTQVGSPLDSRNVTREFHRVLKASGLPAIRFHDLRHTAASLLLVQGISPRTIMETLGHSQISLTMDTYSHVMPSLRREAAAKMDAVLTETTSARSSR